MTGAIDRFGGYNGDLAIKAPVKAATTANITLAGEQTIDGVACVTGDRVLVKNQTTGNLNGIYIVNTSTWTRSPDFDGARDIISGTMIPINQGTMYAASLLKIGTADPLIIGTTALTFVDGTTGSATATAQAAIATAQAATATAQAAAASTSAAQAAAAAELAAGSLIGTSTTSNTIGLGTKSFTTQPNLDLGNGFVIIAETSNPSNYFHGQVTTYNNSTGAAVFNITSIGGSGTFTDWTISVSGPIGPTGPAGGLSVTGTPSSGNLIAFSGASSVTNADLTGAITTSGSGATTLSANAVGTSNVAANAITLAKLATQAGNSVLAEATGSTAVPTAVALSTQQVLGRLGSNITGITIGTGAGNIVQLDASTGKLPAVDGSQLTNLPANGNYALISTTTPSAVASVAITSGFNSSLYGGYRFVLEDMKSASGNVALNYGLSSNGGSTYPASTSAQAQIISGSAATYSSTVDSLGGTGMQYASALPSCIIMDVMQLNTGNNPMVLYRGAVDQFSGTFAQFSGACQSSLSAAVNAIKFAFASGNITSGTIKMYGLLK